jgi:hypothetical protein
MVNMPGLEIYGNVKRHGATVWFPPGTVGYANEVMIIDFIHEHKDTGFGRMIQMIEEMWESVDPTGAHTRNVLEKRIDDLKAKISDKDAELKNLVSRMNDIGSISGNYIEKLKRVIVGKR